MRCRLVLSALAVCMTAVLVFIGLQARPVAVPDAGVERVGCLSYAPYRVGQSPFDPALVIPPQQIEEDLVALSTLTACVRTYATSQGLDAVVPIAGRLGMEVYAGAWIGRDDAANRQEVARLIALARAHPAALRGVIVGNEVLLRGEQPPARLADYIRQVRAGVPASVPVTYADVWEFWADHPELAETVDFVTVHILPYWEDEPAGIDDAVAHVMTVWRGVQAEFAPKPVLIGETGWPSEGRRREGAEPSPVNQTRFVRGFLAAAHEAGTRYNLIEAFDQPWKRALEGTVGGAWGLFDVARQAKVTLSGPVANHPGALSWLAGAVVLGALPWAWTVARRQAGDRRVLALGGVFIAGTAVLQVWHLQASSRDVLEWAVNGGWLVVSLGLSLAVLRHLAGMPCRLTVPAVRLVALAGMAVATLGLVFEPRYRDLPVSMFVGLAVLLALAVGAARPAREQRALAGLLAVGGLWVLANEGLANTHAGLWTATALLLAVPALWPRRG